MDLHHQFGRGMFVAVAFLSTATAGPGNYTQQGPKLASSTRHFGVSVSLSPEGNTALVGSDGTVYFLTRSNGVWTQQSESLVSPETGDGFGAAVALSADGSTAVVGAPDSDRGNGAVWVFTKSNGVWNPVGIKLSVSNSPNAVQGAAQGSSVAISRDGNTLVVGGPFFGEFEGVMNADCDQNFYGYAGAILVFARSNGVWSEQFTAAGDTLSGECLALGERLGGSVQISGDGDTIAASGGLHVYTRSGGAWTQQLHQQPFGTSDVGLTADGNTLLFLGFIFSRKNGVWSQDPNQLVGTQGFLPNHISADGSTIAGDTYKGVDIFVPSGNNWVFHRQYRGDDFVGNSGAGVPRAALSANGDTMIQADWGNSSLWVFASPQLSTKLTHTGNFHRGQTGATYTITVSNVGDRDIHAAPTSAVNLVDKLPAGLIPTGLFGDGWNCTLGTLSCTREDGLAAGASFPPVTLIVNVAGNAPASITNVATASGGGSNWGNAKDATTIVP